MEKFYKGKLFLFSNVERVKINIDLLDTVVDTSSKSFYEWFNALDKDDQSITHIKKLIRFK